MTTLFDCSTDNISLHLKKIFNENELNESSVTEEFSATASDGKNYKTKHYNLDAIIAVGYRVNTKRATAFRQWVTSILRDYAIRGYVIDKKREDWAKRLDKFLEADERDVLQNSGKVTALIAKSFAENEFEKYRIVQDALFESDFDKEIKRIGRK